MLVIKVICIISVPRGVSKWPPKNQMEHVVAFTYILGTLIGRDLPLLLVKLVNISSCDDLLASTQILDIAATLTRLLSGLLTASVVAVFL